MSDHQVFDHKFGRFERLAPLFGLEDSQVRSPNDPWSAVVNPTTFQMALGVIQKKKCPRTTKITGAPPGRLKLQGHKRIGLR